MNRNPDKSKEELLAAEVLALVKRFNAPASHENGRRHTSHRLARMVVPVALEGLALLSFAHQLRARRRHSETPATRLRRGIRRPFALRHL